LKLEIVSANRLTDGRVVYLSHGGRWSEKIVDGRTARNDKESAALLTEAEASVAKCLVIDPYLLTISDETGAFTAMRLRERIRQFGPKQNQTPGQSV